ncbi:GNAT family N-acetyltransferase [Lentibacter algarum]|uniref:GNAT family N-acetyltransferase n=1 Tax=Lentibacter algarum TaxID=576131 RepID=UPI001C07914B|nr:GNAT family N-acetyltransferase [Lentibacter algarum]MBU2981008.1 GNAT family N-acetyltransferase [Lentibacter algarum]
MTNLTIRPVKASDRAAWADLWTAYLDYYETSVADEVYDISFARLLSGEDNEFQGLIAELDGVPVGLTHFLYHRHMWTAANTCYLQDLYVAPETRGTGAGRALIEAVHAQAAADEITTVYWMTQDFNETARKLYDRVATLTPFIKYNKPIG